jgi:hypothetical protein
MRKWIVRGLAVLGVVYLAAIGWIYYIMHLPPAKFAKQFARLPMASMMVMPFESMWMRARAGELQIGEEAPDFELPVVDKSRHVKLSDLRGRPVLLVFGSYT